MALVGSSRTPDFYLASTEGYGLEEPRRCYVVKELRTDTRSDLVLVEIDPPIVGQSYGMGAQDVERVVVVPRHRGESILAPASWPVAVHVTRLLVDPAVEEVTVEQLDLIAWAELYETELAARERIHPPRTRNIQD